MPDKATLQQFFKQLIDAIGQCLSLPIVVPDCKPLWEYVIYAGTAIGLLLILWAVWQLIEYLVQYLAARQEQRERERVADRETMRKHTWDEDEQIADEVTDPHLAEKIRQELEQRRLRNMRNTRFGSR